MQCSCGGIITNRQHEVKSVKAANEWLRLDDDLEVKAMLPVTVIQYSCDGCARGAFKVESKDGDIVRRVNI